MANKKYIIECGNKTFELPPGYDVGKFSKMMSGIKFEFIKKNKYSNLK